MSTCPTLDERLAEAAAAVLNRIDGLPRELKKEQMDALLGAVSKRDVFAILPTGFGKSLIYQILPSILHEIYSMSSFPLVLVVSPLIQLMKQQVSYLNKLGIKSAWIGDMDADAETKEVDLCEILFGGPEIILASKWKYNLQNSELQERIVALVIDEVHCVTEWGMSDKAKQDRAFREWFARLGEIRAFLPTDVPVIALTATATPQTRIILEKTLRMRNPVVVQINPDRTNIKYSICKVSSDPEITFRGLAQEIREKGIQTPRTIIYCRRVKDCSQVYRTFQLSLPGRESFYPQNAETLAKNRLYAMFHQGTAQDIKDTVINSLTNEDGTCRVVIATVALGMGMNFKDIPRVINYGPPNTMEQYVQQCGRAGQDQKQSLAILLWHSRQLKTCDEHMKQFVEPPESCYRHFIFQVFGWNIENPISPSHLCCDFCSKSCSYGFSHQISLEESVKIDHHIRKQSQESAVHSDSIHQPVSAIAKRRAVTVEDRASLEQLMVDVRHRLAVGVGGDDGKCHTLTSDEVTTGITSTFIQSVVQKCDLLFTVDD